MNGRAWLGPGRISAEPGTVVLMEKAPSLHRRVKGQSACGGGSLAHGYVPVAGPVRPDVPLVLEVRQAARVRLEISSLQLLFPMGIEGEEVEEVFC